MKKLITILIMVFSNTVVHAQGLTEALLYSKESLNGTARFQAMSGAFGALGGDFSAINVNPAGAAVFSNNQLSFTLSNFNIKNNSDYLGTSTSSNNSNFDLNQAGVVFVFKDYNPKNDWKKLVLSVNYENVNNFDNSLYSSGRNTNHSIDQYFLSYANPNSSIGQSGINLGILENSFYEDLNYIEQQAFLGYNGYIINPDNPSNANNNTYNSNVPTGTYNQQNYVESTGYNGKLNFNIATQYKDKFYFGLNLNSHFTDLRQSSRFYENNSNSTNSGVRSIRFDNDLYTYGSGFSFQLGAIAKITSEFRAGLTYQSPTWYRLFDELQQTLTTTGYNYGNPPNPNLSSITPDSNIIIVYQPYSLRAPGKWTGSLAYVFGKKGLISLDYTRRDYSNTIFTPRNEFQTPNQILANALDTAGELRIGAEYRIKQVSLRGGFRNEHSPYKNGKTIGDLTGFSSGLGYNFGNTKLDLAYSYAHRNSQNSFFSQGFIDSANIRTKNNNIVMTLLFEL
ncbi:OmpP1/FadL family transporter [Flavobacterium luteum]|uniref:Transporter n=1 Tax=Flavobacterium luteum TaxID=2026654 RepID=A0A7J5ABS5_9FLAO|nr:outer membrane protein transport protein [Flavobacterium luteum]KAB1154980.1 transporter [Flavobacterium luteum]